MLVLIIVLIAAAVIALLSSPAGEHCPKGCHGCGRCTRIDLDIRK